ncbi:MAG TPA: hypothetical protein VMB03_15085 [Bryobacteraceae bacterium]|nr:hypothetical protein [Bryobacteraceae bacterium]
MDSATREVADLTPEEMALIGELLRSEQVKLLVEIRRTDHRVFRDGLRHRLTVVEGLMSHFTESVAGAG